MENLTAPTPFQYTCNEILALRSKYIAQAANVEEARRLAAFWRDVYLVITQKQREYIARAKQASGQAREGLLLAAEAEHRANFAAMQAQDEDLAVGW